MPRRKRLSQAKRNVAARERYARRRLEATLARIEQERARSQEVYNWYEEVYKPWWAAYGNEFTQFREWQQTIPSWHASA